MREGNIEGVQQLVKKNQGTPPTFPLNVNARDEDGSTVLHWAVEQGHFELTAALVKVAGIDLAAIGNLYHNLPEW